MLSFGLYAISMKRDIDIMIIRMTLLRKQILEKAGDGRKSPKLLIGNPNVLAKMYSCIL